MCILQAEANDKGCDIKAAIKSDSDIKTIYDKRCKAHNPRYTNNFVCDYNDRIECIKTFAWTKYFAPEH